MNPLEKIYKVIWSHTTGRPFTYVIRDIYHSLEYFVIVFCFLAGAIVKTYASWKTIGIILGIWTLGYIAGHLFWGTKYIAGQKE